MLKKIISLLVVLSTIMAWSATASAGTLAVSTTHNGATSTTTYVDSSGNPTGATATSDVGTNVSITNNTGTSLIVDIIDTTTGAIVSEFGILNGQTIGPVENTLAKKTYRVQVRPAGTDPSNNVTVGGFTSA